MKLLLLCLLILVPSLLASEAWDSFKKTYNKSYANPREENFRKLVFLERLKLIEEQNRKFEQGLSSFSVAINQFADLTKGELTKPSRIQASETVEKKPSSRTSRTEDVPNSIDWRDYGVITPIADQMFCESCWAFAVVGTVEAHMGIYHQQNVSLSQQNLVDCVDLNFTCGQSLDRGMVEKTYQYIIDNNGIDTVESYPYESYTVGTCRFSSKNVGATIAGYVNITEGDEDELKTVVGTIGPVTVVITTDYMWTSYRDGVYYNEDCMNTSEIFNHVVVIVGYGNENGEDYWLVKNSWGTWFGQEGYIKMARNRDNNCGIASIARYPIM
ncbi:procathepsin L-like [Zophobas morio]|uniref:procathepsin L-like n=1 Tax=Zophobas morio TaxID=2755281 RepID=UPI0030826C67